MLDSSIEPLHKIGVAREVLRTIDDADGRLPDIRPAFAATMPATPTRLSCAASATQLQQQLERAVTSAFGPPFLIASLFALAALAAVAADEGCRAVTRSAAVDRLGSRRLGGPRARLRRTRRRPLHPHPRGRPLRAARVALTARAPSRRSSRSRSRRPTGQPAISASSREELVLALGSESDLDRFAAKHGISREDAESAIRDGLVRAIDDAEQANAISGGTAGRSARDRDPAADRARPRRPSRGIGPAALLTSAEAPARQPPRPTPSRS